MLVWVKEPSVTIGGQCGIQLCFRVFSNWKQTGNDQARCHLGDVWPDPSPVAPAHHDMHWAFMNSLECLPVDPASWVRFPAGAGKIFSLYDNCETLYLATK